MIQNPFHGGNNGGGENFPKQNDSNCQFENSNNRPRNPEVNMNLPPKSTPLPPAVQRSNPPPTLPVNRGTTHIFYKTRMCQKFLEGNCRNGDSCTFAHGANDLREPPPNWQELVKDNNRVGGNWNEDQKIIHQMRICRKFYNTGECPYGEKCNFLHESPSKFKAEAAMDVGRTRESSVINIQTVVDRAQTEACHLLHGNVDAVQVNNVTSDSDALRASMKATYWKTRICSKWETTGQCVFGDKCHFAHGLAELNTPVLRVEGDGHAHGQPYVGFSVAPKPLISPITEPVATNSATTVPVPQGEVKESLKWKLAHKKLNRIYADWIDDEEDEQVSSSKAD